MKKVCILQNGLVRGGTDTFVVNLCKYLDKEKFEVTVINPNGEANIREPEVLRTGASLLHTTPLRGVKGKLRHLVQLYKILREGKFDIFHTNIDLFNGPQLFVAWLARVPVRVCHSHNNNQTRAIREGQTLSIKIYQSVMKWLCWHFSNRRCGCSAEANDFLYARKPWQQLTYPTVINNGIELDQFQGNQSAISLKKDFSINFQYHIITVGRFIDQKNPEFIAEIFCELAKRRKDCDFVWIGEGPLEGKCRNIVADAGIEERVHFLGTRGDVSEILQCCDVFLLPSNFEGFGIVLIEAQAVGLPCVASDQVPQNVNCGGVEFLPLTQPPSYWANVIEEVLEGKRKFSISKIKLDQFSAETTASQMEQVFNSLK